MDPKLIGEILSGLMFFGIIGFLMIGFPVAFTLAGVSLLFGAIGMFFGVFDPSNFGSLPPRHHARQGLAAREALEPFAQLVQRGAAAQGR
jgi:TRAP-type mannitol/chloroaromatic compound transport system permease large subunit